MQLDGLEHLDLQEDQEVLVVPDLEVTLVHQDLLDLQDLLVLPDFKDLQVTYQSI